MNVPRKTWIIPVAMVLFSAMVALFFNPGQMAPVKLKGITSELQRAEVKGRHDPAFADTVVDSTWAMVLVHSEFSRKNAAGLEALRNWAKQQFIQDRQFLNPLELPHSLPNQTVGDSFFSCLFALPARALETAASSYTGSRMQQFYGTTAFQSFLVDYYDLFGVSEESARLLFRYQEDRAKQSTGVLITALLSAVFLAGLSLLRAGSKISSLRGLSSFWFGLGSFYCFNACTENSVAYLAGALFSLTAGIYLFRPFKMTSGQDGLLSLTRFEPSRRTLAVILWVSVTLLFIQIVNWIKGSILTEPDPITLLIGAISGNFIHDPSGVKRSVLEISGVAWLLLSMSVFYLYRRGGEPSLEVESELKSFTRQKISMQ